MPCSRPARPSAWVPGNMRARYLLGNLLALDSRAIRESLGHLERAAEAMPAARETLERVRALLR